MTKKIMALVLAAAITTGIGGFGTYAYFTDRDTLEDNVNITMGTVDVEAYWATDAWGYADWTPSNPATEAVKSGAGLTFTNVKPGDTFVRDVVVANYGTLKGDISVAINPVLAEELGVKFKTIASNSGNVEMDPNVPNRCYENGVIPYGFIRVTVEVTVPADAGNDWMEKVFKVDANQFIEANIHQTI